MTVVTNPTMTPDAFFTEYPDIDRFDLLLPDISGIPRGKRVGRGGFATAFRDGIALPGSIFATRASGESVAASGLVWEIGDADNVCRPVPDTLVAMPWAPRPRGQVLMTMLAADGSPFHGDPRSVLAAVLARYAARGWRPVVALELEFFLITRPSRQAAAPLPATVPATGRPQTKGQVYGFEELDDFEDLLADIETACRIQGVPATAASVEYAASQFEINLNHVDDAAMAADYAVMLKRIVKGVAGAHGIAATFMAKPFADLGSSGMHMHFSILDHNGRNIFAESDGADPLSNPVLRQAVGGLVAQ
jgi:glutamine synthetase